MLHASIKHCPVFGGKVKSFNAKTINNLNGVIKVVRVFDNAIAVVAENTWIAQKR